MKKRGKDEGEIQYTGSRLAAIFDLLDRIDTA
jgi:hypothetical protein